MLRRLADDEKPLQLCLRWSDDGVDSLNRRQFVLQDNVTCEIAVRLISNFISPKYENRKIRNDRRDRQIRS